jgi:hypothetical protein
MTLVNAACQRSCSTLASLDGIGTLRFQVVRNCCTRGARSAALSPSAIVSRSTTIASRSASLLASAIWWRLWYRSKNLSPAARKRFHISSDLLRRIGPIVFQSCCSRFSSLAVASQSVGLRQRFCARAQRFLPGEIADHHLLAAARLFAAAREKTRPRPRGIAARDRGRQSRGTGPRCLPGLLQFLESRGRLCPIR